VKRRLREAGIFGRAAARKPLLRPTNKKKRLVWGKEHINWTPEQWSKVLWTDESKFELFGSKRRVYVRRRAGERMKDECVQPSVKHGGGSCMVWGCFAGASSGHLVEVKGTMKKEQYHSILQRHAIPSGIRMVGRNFILQQDNDPKHTSKLCRDYLKRKESTGVLKVMCWPPQSPDLSPIELAWDELNRRVKRKQPSNVTDLFRCLTDAWNELSEDYFQKLVERMPRVCAAVVKAKGGYFDETTI